jgi:uncharacterized repeat protein (TIGR01451 family)
MAFGQHGALRVTEPKLPRDHTIMTTEPAIQLQGTLEWAGGDTRILWKNERGFSDLASVKVAEDRHTIEWSTTAPIPLRPGINQVRIRALGQSGGEFVNVYYTVQSPPPPPRQSATLFKGQQITYEEINGLAVYQSDMILGTPDEAKAGRFRGRLASGGMHIRPQSLTITPNLTYASGLWPIVNGVVRVPYEIANTSGDFTNLSAAIAESNSQLAGVVQWVPATGSDTNYVSFNFNGPQTGSCEAIVGMQGGPQAVGGASNCTVNTILHEMGHALGLYHEQSRADRNTWVNYSEANVDKPQHANFDIFPAEVDSGLYNYASIMEYSSFLFSRYGVSPVLESIPAGMVLGTDLQQYTTGDIDGIMRLYGFFPSQVTVDSNPTGLQLVVDNVTCTAPCVFSNWTLGSQHTLAVSQTIQTVGTAPGEQSYLFGRWNSDVGNTQAASVTVTNSAGNGTLLSPATSPAITNYLASFIPLHPYSPVVQSNNDATPSSVGSISVNPAPYTGTLNGVPNTSYFKDRQQIQLTATAKSGYTFHHWGYVSLPTFYTTFLNFFLTSNLDHDGMGDPVTALFVNDAVTTVSGESTDGDITLGISPGFSFGVVENGTNPVTTLTAYTPRNFDASQDESGFAAGKSLTLCGSGMSGTTCPATPVPQSPVTTNMTFTNYSWNGTLSSNTNALTIPSIPANGGQYGLNLTYTFRVIILPSIFSSAVCPNIQISTNPAGVTANQSTDGGLDAFYAPVQTEFRAAGSGTVTFASWSGDLGGSGNPYDQTIIDQLIATANYNVVANPLTVTGVSWTGSPGATGSATTLTVNGTGFTTNGNTYVYYGIGGGQFTYRTVAVQSSTQLTVQLLAGDLSTVGYNQILVVNTSASGCNPQTPFTFGVSVSGGAPAFAISKMHSGVFGPGEQNAQYTILVTNTGTASVTQPVTVTDTLPSGETIVSMAGQAGSGWSCSIQTAPYTCTNSNTLAPQASYGTIRVTVNVNSNATSPQVNTATVSGGGAEQATATDSTVIATSVLTPNVNGEPLNTAEGNINGAGETVGNVTYATSPTVPAGDVISTTPAAGVSEPPGTPVSIVVSLGPLTLQSITVTPANPSIAKGQTQQFKATGIYNDGTTPDITNSVTWGSGTPAYATISSSGLATGQGVGQSTITAMLGGVTGSTTLTVGPAALVSIAVTPTNPSIVAGSTQQFTATGTYTDGTQPIITGAVSWSSQHTNVATIGGAGKATGVAGGSTTITASMGTSPVISGSTTLTVTGLSACDVNQTGSYNPADVQTMIDEALGKNSPVNDLNGDGVVNVVDIEIVTYAVLHQVCIQ